MEAWCWEGLSFLCFTGAGHLLSFFPSRWSCGSNSTTSTLSSADSCPNPRHGEINVYWRAYSSPASREGMGIFNIPFPTCSLRIIVKIKIITVTLVPYGRTGYWTGWCQPTDPDSRHPQQLSSSHASSSCTGRLSALVRVELLPRPCSLFGFSCSALLTLLRCQPC